MNKVLLIGCLCFALSAVAFDQKRVCYYTNWSQYRAGNGKFVPENIDVSLCTHLVFAFAKLENNHLLPREWNDESTPWSKGLYERFNDLKKKKPGLKTLLSVGGAAAGTAEMTKMLETSAGRAEFARNAVKFLRDRKFDGLDLCFEHPGSNGSPAEDKERFTLLLEEFQAVFKAESTVSGKEKLLLSAAAPAGKPYIDAGYEVEKINDHLDFINLMSYDYHGTWEVVTGHLSPLFSDDTLNVNWSASYWVSEGADPAKLVLGTAMYGRCFVLSDPEHDGIGAAASGACAAGPFTGEPGFLAYYEICPLLKTPGSKQVWSEEQKVSYFVTGNVWIGFENKQSLEFKSSYAKQHGFGGVMAWETSFDDFLGSFCGQGTYPLLNALDESKM